MSKWKLIVRSLFYFRYANGGLFAGTAVASMILTGALVVGDSVDHTLKTFALQRLGSVEYAIASFERIFDQESSEALGKSISAPVAPVLALRGMALYQDPSSGGRTQINRAQVIGVDETFWTFGDSGSLNLGRREAVVDERVASRLGVNVGDMIALRIPTPGLLSRDAPLSSREEESSQRANFTVAHVASDRGMGQFSLAPSQIPPYNVFVRLADLQELSDSPEQVNLMLVGAGPSQSEVESALKASWKPEYAGIHVRSRTDGILQLESDRIFLDEATERAALSLPGADGALSYLVNTIHHGERMTPYSFMTAGGALSRELAEDEMVINEWLATQLQVQAGDRLTVTYVEVMPSNQFEERSREFTVKRVLPMADFTIEKDLVPEFPGLSNVESCKDWKIGMPMDEALLEDDANEAYWKEFRQTPKAIVSLAAGQAMWANRFGRLSAVRFDAGSATPEGLMSSLTKVIGPRDAGIEVRPVREEADQATSQAMDLGGLFLGMSLFLLGSALLLTGMLYAFGSQQRAPEIGLLAALGMTRRAIRFSLLTEALLIALPGAVIGSVLGTLYAWLLLLGLSHGWQDAVGRIPILFDAQIQSFVVGSISIVLCALIAVTLALRRLLTNHAVDLLHADFTQADQRKPVGRKGLVTGLVAFAASMGLVFLAYISPPTDLAGIFFGSGFLMLVSGLFLCRFFIFRTRNACIDRVPSTFSLATLNATRRRGRSMGLVSSIAAGGFLVIAVSSMQSDVRANADQRWSGTGGFELFAESTLPVLSIDEFEEAAPVASAVGIRVFEGDDASCLNLNRAIRPRVLGIDESQMAELGAFTGESESGIWSLLEQDYGEGIVPALVGDSDTAMWTLRKKADPETGDILAYTDEAGRDISVKLVGRLPMRLSVFQGTILISAKTFTALWPSQEGFRVFLVDVPFDHVDGTADSIQRAFDRYGMDVTTTPDRLAMFHAVEGTYLNMFLVLGGIGLLLGATASGVVVLRNLLERRREIALLRTVGFTHKGIVRLLACEYGLLLVSGTAAGAVASVVAMLPSMTASHYHGSPIWRLTVFASVLGIAAVFAGLGIAAGLRRTDVDVLRTE
ncbi:MAG: hypothetical protein AMXMBFR84_35430 [Candidatus Hydrogenedentota bacterium]